MTTFSAGEYVATITDNLIVEVRYQGTLIDNPGPWADHDSAVQWAEAIVNKWSVTGHEIV